MSVAKGVDASALARKVAQAISAGQLDGQLRAVIDAAVNRRRYLDRVRASENQISLVPGTRVQLCGNISPKYLYGERGVVVDREPKAGFLWVQTDRTFNRFGNPVATPAACLREV